MPANQPFTFDNYGGMTDTSNQVPQAEPAFSFEALGGNVSQPESPQVPSPEVSQEVSEPQGFNFDSFGGLTDTGPQEEEGSWGQAFARRGKDLVSGAIGGAVDMATAAYNIPAQLFNAISDTSNSEQAKANKAEAEKSPGSAKSMMYNRYKSGGDSSQKAPLIASAQQAIDKKIDEKTGDYTKTPEDEKWLSEGIKTASSIASTGGLGAVAGKMGAKGTAKVLQTLGSTNPSAIAAAGVTSAVTEKTNFGSGIAAGALTSILTNKASLKSLAQIPNKTAAKILGVDPKNLKTEVMEAAQRLGVDLPAVAVTDSKLTAHLNQYASKTPFIGEMIKEKVSKASEQFKGAFEEMANKVGPLRNEAVESEIRDLYSKAAKQLPKDAQIVPNNTVNAIKSIRDKVKTALPSKSENELLATLDKLEGNIMFDKKLAVPMPVEMLLGTKRSLNSAINWETDSGVKTLIKKAQGAMLKDIEEYGKANPAWKKTFNEAERSFEKVAKREQLENLISGKFLDPISKEVSYNPLAKRLNNRKSLKDFEKVLGKGNTDKLKDFAKVAESMVVAQRNTPNPSGTAVTQGVTNLITGIGAGMAGAATAVPVALGAAGVTKLLTSKKFLNMATRYAKNPSDSLASHIGRIVKNETGVTLQELGKE